MKSMANTILTLKEKDTMQIHRAKSKLLLLTGLSVLLTGCSISDWYNGYYAETASIRRVHKERNAYYEAESPEMKELRKKIKHTALIWPQSRKIGLQKKVMKMGFLMNWIGYTNSYNFFRG
jgi:hypothetical protein